MVDLIRLIVGFVTDLFRSKGSAGSRSPRASATDHYSAPRYAKPTSSCAEVGVRLDLLAVSERPRRSHHHPTGNRPALASRGLSILRALEVERLAGCPVLSAEIEKLIREASPVRWGAPRIHGELLKLGIDVG
jgi:hypothetical protein